MESYMTDSHLDTRKNVCIIMNVIAPKLVYVEVWEGNSTAGNSTDGYSKTYTRMFKYDE